MLWKTFLAADKTETVYIAKKKKKVYNSLNTLGLNES